MTLMSMQTSISNRRRRLRGRTQSLAAAVCALACALAVAPQPARADLTLSGSAEVTLRIGERAALLNTMARGDNPFNPVRLRLFADSRVDSSLSFFSEMLLDNGAPVRLQGAYVAVRPQFAPVEIQAGLIPFGVGLYPDRCYPEQNPLIAAPLLYQHHTLLRRGALLPSSADSILAMRLAVGGMQSLGVQAGLPVVDEEWWDTGIMVRGGYTTLEYTFGITNGTLSNPRGVENNEGKQVLGRFSAHLGPTLALGGSYAFGPYLDRSLASQLPAGESIGEYRQYVYASDVEFQLGHLESSGEVMLSSWDVPTRGVDDVTVTGGYFQSRYVISPGLFVAGRVDAMRFSRITGVDGVPTPWDANLDRIETGVGYYFSRDALMKLEYQGTHGQSGTRIAGWQHMLALQLSARF